ncbi:hypothetical protein M885DRAFT_573113 [Pelagophyceae sp. CCMP2097]|nr:hypothetical protein M885DRAFT_573113 [Pelagophyceae sp. CCMP2097]
MPEQPQPYPRLQRWLTILEDLAAARRGGGFGGQGSAEGQTVWAHSRGYERDLSDVNAILHFEMEAHASDVVEYAARTTRRAERRAEARVREDARALDEALRGDVPSVQDPSAAALAPAGRAFKRSASAPARGASAASRGDVRHAFFACEEAWDAGSGDDAGDDAPKRLRAWI